MSWFAVGAAAVTVVSSSMQQKEAAGQVAGSVKDQARASIKSNIKNTIRTGYRVGMLNVQRGLSKRLAAQKGFDTTVAAQSALGAVTANQAASGTIGASIDAVANDVKMKLGEAQAAQREDFEIDALNYNAQLADIIQQGQDSIVTMGRTDLPSGGKIMGNALLAGAGTFASMYAGSQMNLGLGSNGATQGSLSVGQGSANLTGGGIAIPSSYGRWG